MHAGGARFERDHFADGIGELGSPVAASGHGAGEGGAFVEAHAGAGFEVGADEERNFRAALKFVGDDGGGIDLAALDPERAARGADDHAADVVFLDLVEQVLYSALSVEVNTPK